MGERRQLIVSNTDIADTFFMVMLKVLSEDKLLLLRGLLAIIVEVEDQSHWIYLIIGF